MFAVGGIRTAAEARGILEGGEADMVGIGRPFYAEPDLARRLLGPATPTRRAATPTAASRPRCSGMKGVCYTPEARRVAAELRRRTTLA